MDLIDFNVRLSTMGQVEKIVVRGWNPANKEKYIAQSDAGEEPSMGNTATGSSAVQKAFGKTGAVTVDQPVHSQAEADQIAGGRLNQIALTYIEGYGACIGNVELSAGVLVEVEGVSQRFSGPYYVTSAEHTYNPSVGYRTALTIRRNAT